LYEYNHTVTVAASDDARTLAGCFGLAPVPSNLDHY